MARTTPIARSILTACCALALGPSHADDFHGFDPESHDGKMLSKEQLAAMVDEAEGVTAPRNGEGYVVGFANLQRDITFGVVVEKGIQQNADAAGIELLVVDNRLDGPTALANAQSFVQRDVDYVIEFQTDVNFGPTVMKVFDDDGVGVVAIDIPMPGATFFGANNPKSGFMGGSYLAQAAIAKLGEEEVKRGYFVLGDLPQSGAIPAMRSEGQLEAFLSQVDDFPADHVIRIDTKNTLQESFSQMANVLNRIPEGVPIMIIAINDQSALGMVRAATQANREADVIAVGNGADETQALVEEDAIIASTGYFPERYGNFLVPIALASLAGRELPPAILMNHVMITDANVCEYYPDYECGEPAGFEYEFPQAAFEEHLRSLAGKEILKGYETLIPGS